MMTVNTMIAGLNNVADDVKFVGANVDKFDCVHVGGVIDINNCECKPQML